MRRSRIGALNAKTAVRAKHVVVSAGVLGTLNLLLKCRNETGSLPLLSDQLGLNVRSNSEALMGVTAREENVAIPRAWRFRLTFGWMM
jgi:cholesterol oxidase